MVKKDKREEKKEKKEDKKCKSSVKSPIIKRRKDDVSSDSGSESSSASDVSRLSSSVSSMSLSDIEPAPFPLPVDESAFTIPLSSSQPVNVASVDVVMGINDAPARCARASPPPPSSIRMAGATACCTGGVQSHPRPQVKRPAQDASRGNTGSTVVNRGTSNKDMLDATRSVAIGDVCM